MVTEIFIDSKQITWKLCRRIRKICSKFLSFVFVTCSVDINAEYVFFFYQIEAWVFIKSKSNSISWQYFLISFSSSKGSGIWQIQSFVYPPHAVPLTDTINAPRDKQNLNWYYETRGFKNQWKRTKFNFISCSDLRPKCKVFLNVVIKNEDWELALFSNNRIKIQFIRI